LRLKTNLINLDRIYGEIIILTLWSIRLRGGLQASNPKVNLLIRLTTIAFNYVSLSSSKKGKIVETK